MLLVFTAVQVLSQPEERPCFNSELKTSDCAREKISAHSEKRESCLKPQAPFHDSPVSSLRKGGLVFRETLFGSCSWGGGGGMEGKRKQPGRKHEPAFIKKKQL